MNDNEKKNNTNNNKRNTTPGPQGHSRQPGSQGHSGLEEQMVKEGTPDVSSLTSRNFC